MKAFKVFNNDWTCRDFQYKLGKTYKHNGKVELCKSGFHACKLAADCFNYYSFSPSNKVAEVELLGDVIHGDNKSVCSKIKIVREIKWEELLALVNTGKSNSGYGNSGGRNSGDWNSGYGNSGGRNSGDWNSGYGNSGGRNSGDCNSGYGNSGYGNSGGRNSGDWNSCNNESGFFNSEKSDKVRVFNNLIDRSEWEDAQKPSFIYGILLNKWIWWNDMTDKEKEQNKDAYITNGYLKTYSYKEAWFNAYENATENDIKLLKALPCFDPKVFEEITGIKL